MSKISQRVLDRNRRHFGNHKKYLSRITKTLYYGVLPKSNCLSKPVTDLAVELFSDRPKGESLEQLHYYDAARISNNACVSTCSLVLALLYLERLKKCNPKYLIQTAPSDVFLVSLMVSCKFLFDDGESDAVFFDDWIRSSGITKEELLKLERNFLKAIDWEVYVNELTFWKKLNEIETILAEKQGCSRGFFTYTELQNLLGILEVYNIIYCVVTVSLILAATYTAGLITIVGSMFLTSQIPGTSLHASKTDMQIQSMPIMYHNEDEIVNTNEILEEILEMKTDTKIKLHGRNLDAVNVLKTGILLASIKSIECFSNATNSSDYDALYNNDVDVQKVSWDWWNVPTMIWLSKATEFVDNFRIPTLNFWPFHFFDISLIGFNQVKRDTNIDKATKTRIQDQMETSWHKEWTDTIKYGFFYNRIFTHQYNIHNIKT